MNWLRGLLVTCFVLAASSTASRAGPVTQIVAFGDSLTDTGNVFAATGGLAPASPPYFAGRFSNGPVWVEQLAARLGVPDPGPALLGGTNYAFAGAETGGGFSTPVPGLNVPNIGTQIAAYLAGNSPRPGQLFVVWGGANDFLDGQTNPAVPVANLVADITALAQAGAKTFLVPNLPLLGTTPEGLSLPPAQRQGLNALSLAFDALLGPALDQLAAGLGITIDRLDTLSLFQAIEANPGAFGFTDVTDQAKSGPVGFPGSVVPNPDQFLFWDPIHPTAHAHQLIGDQAALAVVPEPSSLALLALGGVGLAGWRGWKGRRRRGGVR
jgi:phospholipase/lecithinase/hemolysin